MESPWYFNRRNLLAFAIIFCGISFALSFTIYNKNLFSSSGAIITVAGLFLNIKHTMVFHLKIPLIKKYNIKTGGFKFSPKELSEDQENYIKEILDDEKYGVLFMIFGTLIWAYGSHLIVACKDIVR